jgi:hypothetical protein
MRHFPDSAKFAIDCYARCHPNGGILGALKNVSHVDSGNAKPDLIQTTSPPAAALAGPSGSIGNKSVIGTRRKTRQSDRLNRPVVRHAPSRIAIQVSGDEPQFGGSPPAPI